MGSSSSKTSGKRFGNGAREFLSASMSVNLPGQGAASVPPGQTERAPFVNHPIYLPSPLPSSLSQKQHKHGNHFVPPDHSSSWRAYNITGKDPSALPLESYNNSNDHRQHHQHNHRHHYSNYHLDENNLGQNHDNRYKRQRRKKRQERLTHSVALVDGAAAREQVAPPGRLKGALASVAPGRQRRVGGGDADGVGALGAAKQGRRSRMLVPPPPPPLPRAPSSSLSHGESVGSLLDLCCCAECCSAEGEERCYCSSTISSTGEAAERARPGYAGGDHVHGYHDGVLITKPSTAKEHLSDRQHFLSSKQLHVHERQSQFISNAVGGNSNINIATNGEQEYHIATSRQEQVLFRRRRKKKLGQLEAGREESQEATEEDSPTTTRLRPDNLNDNDEAITCSAGSSSDLQHPRRQSSALAVSTASNGYTKQQHSYNRNNNHHHYNNNNNNNNSNSNSSSTTNPDLPRALRATKIRAVQINNMASTAASHFHNNNCKQSSAAAATTTNKTSIPSHKQTSLERGLAYDDETRKRHGLLGLLPAAVQDQALQSRAVINYIDNCKDELSQYVYLRNLKDFNEKLFYYTLINNVQRLMPLVYTPTVGLACQKFSQIYMRPRGLFITANDAGRVRQVIGNWPETDVRVIVVTDGERILGLGDLGANGMGISIGKLSLYTSLAGIPPQNVLPVTIDVGTENESNLKDPFYIGLRQSRVRGGKYETLIDEFMQAVVERWGRSCLIQFEDFANSTAFNLLKRYKDQYCTFNDDIQGTASVSLSGLISAAKLTGKRLGDCSFLFYGAGEANLGTAQLLIMAMVEDGLKEAEAKERIWLVDSKGLVVSSRQDLNGHKREFARDAKPLKELEAIIDLTKPSAIIGASAQGGSFTESICKKMATYNERPIIFALSNPTSKAECTADQAYRWTNGKCVFASGSPFDPVEYQGKTFITGQGNNAYIFPGVGLAAIGAHTHTIPNETFLVAARALSDQVRPSDTEVGLVYPKLTTIREVTLKVAARVLEYLFVERLATYRPEPSDKVEFLRGIQYDPSY